ncbi:MAG: hypothetical protein WBW73_11030 [Rhodoplanes sp.]
MVKRKSAVVAAFTPEAVLKREIRAHLRKLGFHSARAGAYAYLRSHSTDGLIVADHLDPDGKVVWRLTELGRSVLEGETLDDVLGDLTDELWAEFGDGVKH